MLGTMSIPKKRLPPSGTPRTVRFTNKKYRDACRRGWKSRKLRFAEYIRALVDEDLGREKCG
jgi:hypothetical protein